MSSPKAGKDIHDLIAIMAALRTPKTGCPWDLEQSFETVAPYTIEEAYEVIDAIERGDCPKWKMYVQVMPEEEAETYRFHPFDLTKVWPHKDYPLMQIGEFELNENPQNYFAEIEQAAFEPSNLPRGLGASPDKMLQARLMSYADAHRYRIGINYAALPVNRAACPVMTYHRDGQTRFDGNFGGTPVYEPNSFGGPAVADGTPQEPPMPLGALADRYGWPEDDTDYYGQPRELYAVMQPDERKRLAMNFAGALADVPEVLDAPIAVVDPTAAKGLEFDHVVVVEPVELVSDDLAGLRLLYVTLSRATRSLTVVHSGRLPEALAAAVPVGAT